MMQRGMLPLSSVAFQDLERLVRLKMLALLPRSRATGCTDLGGTQKTGLDTSHLFERRAVIVATMIFKKGNKVEVWNRREVPSGAWWSAEIVSGNGNNYAVRYDGYPADSSVAVDRVPRKSIRPCPPSAVGLKDLMSGDVVEVSDNNSWKLAEVLMVVDKNYCLVRLIGSSRELRADKSLVRNRLSWQDNKWMMIYKVTSDGLNSLFNCS
ncbi:hypothetical protein GW17_00021554 [Ensete ventricosum]|nr:hypothetical protein GW17_00021554 [Ensete ventricosum]